MFRIEFFNGIVAYKLDPSLIKQPEVVKNRPSNCASDFPIQRKKIRCCFMAKSVQTPNRTDQGWRSYAR